MGLESKIITAICTELQYYENQGKLLFIRNNTGAIKKNNRFFRFGKKGSSDIIIFLPNGKTIFLEIKAGDNNLTDAQKKFKTAIEKLGFKYIVKRDNKDIDKIIKI